MGQEHQKTPRAGDRCRRAALCPQWWVLAVVFCLIVSAGCGGHSATHTPSLVSLQIQSPASTVLLGRSEQLAAIGKFDDGSSQDVTASATWSSGNTFIALVGDKQGRKGFFTGIGGGSATISAVSGAITATSSFTVTVPTPRFAYLVEFAIPTRTQTISAYTVDPNTGTLNPVPGATAPVSGSFGVSPDSNFLYAPCLPIPTLESDGICSFAIDRNTGILHSASTTPILAQATSVVISPSGRFLYAVLAPFTIAGFSIDARTGVLTQLPNSAVLPGGMIAIDPAERFLYSAAQGGDGTIAGFNIDQQTGTLSSISGSPFHAPIAVGTTLTTMAMDVAGRSVCYDFEFTVSNLALDGMTGSLTPLSGAPFPTKFPGQIVTSGRFLYASDSVFGGISQFSIDPTTGKISASNNFSTPGFPGLLTIDPSGNFLYALDTQSQTLQIYAIDSSTGALILSSTMALGAPPTTLLIQLVVIG
jgi:6-phosphogluconolactonase (cycloisomerase 2 family)